jgi:hypothetical protein
MDLDTVRALRREGYGERHQFFESAWNCAVGNGGFVKRPKGLHCRGAFASRVFSSLRLLIAVH